jgi:peptidoglycan/LPS O-acetylase OafA/YrhL
MTIGGRLTDTGGRPAGFDYLRLALALSVLWMHSVATSYGQATDVGMWTTFARPGLRLILPMFFALSGFLVAGSLERTRTLGMFLALRAIRIYPALSVEVLLSAVILGPIYTDQPLQSYFGSDAFYSYLLNVTGHIHYFLPGVFEGNPVPGVVNAQLWTVPYELYCYLGLAVLFLLGLMQHRVIAPLGAAVVTVAYLLFRLWRYHGWGPTIVGGMPGPMLIACFLLGVSIYLYRDRIGWNRTLFAGASALSVAALGFLPFGELIAPLPVSYISVYIGLMSPRRFAIVKGADYSYGIFLYGYAIQQAFAALGDWTHHWYINILVCTPLAAVFAALSWNFVEKPALRLRKRCEKIEAIYLRYADPLRRSAIVYAVRLVTSRVNVP